MSNPRALAAIALVGLLILGFVVAFSSFPTSGGADNPQVSEASPSPNAAPVRRVALTDADRKRLRAQRRQVAPTAMDRILAQKSTPKTEGNDSDAAEDKAR